MAEKDTKKIKNPKNTKPEQEGISRREATARIVTGAAASAVTINAIRTGGILASIKTLFGAEEAKADTEQDATTKEAKEHAHDLPAWLDIGTAGAVAGNFVRHVIWRGAVKGHELGPKSAGEMNALAFSRIGALSVFGGEEGGELAHEELEEIKGGLIPLPVLVALSDATTTELKVDTHEIFKSVEGALEAELDYSNIDRPSLGAEVGDWQEHLEKVNKDIVTKAAQVAAITSVLAPLGTTYTSSSLANLMKGDMLKILYEQSYAKEVIRQKTTNGKTVEKEEVQTVAKERAEKLFNGSRGYSKLMFALAANIQGSWGIGDPPEIYFAMNHGSDLKTMALAHGVGAANSEFYTLLLNGAWLAETGAISGSALPEFLKAQGTAIAQVSKTIGNSDLRDTSFGQGGGKVKQVISALNDDSDPSGKLRDVLAKMPKARLQFSPKTYVKAKMDYLTGHGKRVAGVRESAIHSAEDFSTDPAFTDLFKAFASQDMKRVGQMIGALEERLQGKKAEEMAGFFEVLMQDSKAGADVIQDEPESEDSVVGDESKTEVERQKMLAVDELRKDLLKLGHTDRERRMQKAREALGLGGADLTGENSQAKGREVYKVLQQADESTVKRALAELTSVEEKEDAIEGIEDPDHPGVPVQKRSKDTNLHFISHNAKEVLYALLTQIPSVPAISRLAKVGIPLIAGVKNGETPTSSQLKTIVASMLPIEAGMSAVADNVAAYIFAENVLYSFFERTYGKALWTEFPDLKGEIGVIAKLIAEQAGSLTQVGNGPNFSQEKCVITFDDSNKQGIAIDRQKVQMGETLPHKNHYASFANASLVFSAVAYLYKQIDKISETRAKATPETVVMSRRGLFGKFLSAA